MRFWQRPVQLSTSDLHRQPWLQNCSSLMSYGASAYTSSATGNSAIHIGINLASCCNAAAAAYRCCRYAQSNPTLRASSALTGHSNHPSSRLITVGLAARTLLSARRVPKSPMKCGRPRMKSLDRLWMARIRRTEAPAMRVLPTGSTHATRRLPAMIKQPLTGRLLATVKVPAAETLLDTEKLHLLTIGLGLLGLHLMAAE